ncbi:hypothetical protein [Novosphingobium rosa]|uniref:hypothetical protein n=1 Tax=Novosphingobium rosa TaxID=76978 RepID=UPI0008310199|nr:hypothetical protein [Novosphingobium rosa]
MALTRTFPLWLPRRAILLAMAPLASSLLGACATTYPAPPPPGWRGEGWARHVARCERHYPRYDPRTDLIYRPGGTFSCPL